MSDVNGPEPQESGHTAELPTVPGGVDLAALTASVAVPAPGEEYQVPPWQAGARPPARPAAPPPAPAPLSSPAPSSAPPPASVPPSAPVSPPTAPPAGLPARRPTPPVPVVTRPAAPPPRRRRGRVLVAGLVALTVLGAAGRSEEH